MKTIAILLLCVVALPAALTQDQIEAAILHGAKYKNQDTYFAKNSKKRPVDIAPAVGNGTRLVYVFGDWDMVGAQSALAHQLMKPFSATDIRLTGNVHVLIRVFEVGAGHARTHALLGIGERVNFVLQIDGNILQPLSHETLTEGESALATGTASLLFHFSVPETTRQVRATFADAAGKRTTRTLDLTSAFASRQ